MSLRIRSHIDYGQSRPAVPTTQPVRLFRIGPWSDDETAELRKLFAAGHSYAQIGKLMGRAVPSVQGKLNNMGLIRRKDTHRDWTDDELRTLKKLLASGTQWPRICEVLGRTKGAVQAQAHRLGLVLTREADGRRKQKVKRHW